MKLTILGTGNAQALNCFNTCFTMNETDDYLLVDTGGGNGILRQLNSANIPLLKIHHIFLSHAHTDHVLGLPWVVRMIATAMNQGTYEGNLTIWCHKELIDLLTPVCLGLLPAKINKYIGNRIQFTEIHPNEHLSCLGMDMTVLNIESTKTKQYGFTAILPDGQRFAFLGDESYNDVYRTRVQGSDWLLMEAFCVYEDRDIFKPYEKHHSTAKDAASIAESLGVKHLVLYHTEDKTLATRKQRYSAEAAKLYHGQIHVPDDLEIIPLSDFQC